MGEGGPQGQLISRNGLSVAKPIRALTAVAREKWGTVDSYLQVQQASVSFLSSSLLPHLTTELPTTELVLSLFDITISPEALSSGVDPPRVCLKVNTSTTPDTFLNVGLLMRCLLEVSTDLVAIDLLPCA